MDQIIDSIFYGESAGLPENWNILFAPTGLLQEASMANGWGGIFLKLAGKFDSLEPVAKQFEAEHSARGNRGHE